MRPPSPPRRCGRSALANISRKQTFLARIGRKYNANDPFRIMRRRSSSAKAGLLLAGIAASLLAPGDAKAVLNCTFGLTGACTSSPESNLKFSNFSFSGTGAEAADSIQIQKVGPGEIYTIALTAANQGQFDTSANLSYKITPINGYKLLSAQASSTVQGLVSPPFSFNYTSSNLPAFSTSGNTTSIFPFASPLSSSDIAINWASSYTASGTTLTVSLQKAPSVPGPLPLLGAASALGCARRLRRRTRSAG